MKDKLGGPGDVQGLPGQVKICIWPSTPPTTSKVSKLSYGT
jgi:hypothetical protein